MTWTDERVETLKRMWAEGQSASQIAKELGGVTRNAVIGKVHRLGLSNRNASGEPAKARDEQPDTVAERTEAPAKAERPEAAPAPEAEKPAAEPSASAPAAPPVRKHVPGQPLPPQPSANEISPEALAKASEAEKLARRISLMELTERTCKWPLGDPATDDFFFCGLAALPGKPYCEAHTALAYQPMSARRDRKR